MSSDCVGMIVWFVVCRCWSLVGRSRWCWSHCSQIHVTASWSPLSTTTEKEAAVQLRAELGVKQGKDAKTAQVQLPVKTDRLTCKKCKCPITLPLQEDMQTWRSPHIETSGFWSSIVSTALHIQSFWSRDTDSFLCIMIGSLNNETAASIGTIPVLLLKLGCKFKNYWAHCVYVYCPC